MTVCIAAITAVVRGCASCKSQMSRYRKHFLRPHKLKRRLKWMTSRTASARLVQRGTILAKAVSVSYRVRCRNNICGSPQLLWPHRYVDCKHCQGHIAFPTPNLQESEDRLRRLAKGTWQIYFQCPYCGRIALYCIQDVHHFPAHRWVPDRDHRIPPPGPSGFYYRVEHRLRHYLDCAPRWFCFAAQLAKVELFTS
jgi:hypothetical protein